MNQCILLAKKALVNGNPPVGAILVLNDTVIGEGIEAGKSSGDLTNHAEILAIKDALKRGYEKGLHLAKMYTTHEPCIMCSYLIRHHKINHIIYGITVDYIGGFTSEYNILATEKVPKWGNGPEILGGICKSACEDLTKQFHNVH